MQITYLEMLSPKDLNPDDSKSAELRIEQAEIPSGELNRFFYLAVGRNWRWTDRLVWSLADWQSYVEFPEVQTWIASVRGTPVGYFELATKRAPGVVDPDGPVEVEIAYFGLLPQFTGKGYGKTLLTRAIEIAWDTPGAARVWVHTCDLDSPFALPNYQNRGMKVYKVEEETD